MQHIEHCCKRDNFSVVKPNKKDTSEKAVPATKWKSLTNVGIFKQVLLYPY